MKRIIVSRHAGEIEFIRSHKEWADAPVLENPTADDVANAVVAGNGCYRLGFLAKEVHAVEGAHLVPYVPNNSQGEYQRKY